MSTWFDQSNNANKFRQTYVKGFVDVSGGGVMIRSDNSLNLYTTSDTSVPTFSIQASSYSVKHDGNTTTVLTEKLRHLVDLDENTQDRLDDHTRRTQHMDACANVTYFVEDVSMSGDIKVSGSSTLDSTLVVTGAATLSSTLTVSNATTLSDTLDVSNATTLSSTLDVSGATVLDSTLDVSGATTLSDTLTVSDATTLSDTLDVSGATVLDSTLAVSDATTLSSTLTVSNATTLSDTLDVSNATTLSSTLDVSGATVLDSTLAVSDATTLSSTLDVSGATVLDSTLAVSDATTLSSTLDVSGATVLDSTLTVSNATTLSSTLTVTNATTLSDTLDVSNATTLSSTLDVTGLTTMTSAVATTDISTAALHVDDIHINSNDIYSTAGTDIIIRPGNNQSYSDDVDRKVRVVGDLHVDGSINFTGDFIKTDTIVRVTEQMDVSNNGTGPAFIARQHGTGAGYDIAEFYDDASLAVAIKDGGHVDMHNDVHVGGNMDISGTFLVTSTSTFNNDITIQNNADIDMTAGGFIHQV